MAAVVSWHAWTCAICGMGSADGSAHEETCPNHPQAFVLGKLRAIEKRLDVIEAAIATPVDGQAQ